MLTNKLRLEATVTVSRGVYLHITIVSDDGLAAYAVAAVARVFTRDRVFV